MKMLTRRVPAWTAFSVATLFAFQAARSSAQIFAQDDAGAYTTWTNNMNLGSGFGPWILDQTGTFPPTSYTGFFIGNPDGIGTGANNANAWGIYANGSSLTNAAVAYRGSSRSDGAVTASRLPTRTRRAAFVCATGTRRTQRQITAPGTDSSCIMPVRHRTRS